MVTPQHRVLAAVGSLVLSAGIHPPAPVDAAPALTQTISCGDTAALVAAVASTAVTTLVLNPGHLAACTYKFTAPYMGSDTALPPIARPLMIEGNGSTLAGPYCPACPGDWSFRLIAVAALGDLQLNHATVTGGKPAAQGGGIYVNPGARAELTGVSVTGNGGGGGIHNEGTLSLSGSTVSNNVSQIAGGYGGGIYNYQGAVTIANSVISGNYGDLGGGIYNFKGGLGLLNTAVTGNSPVGGGGIYTDGAATIANSVISGNQAAAGGGIANFSTLTLFNTSVTGNTAAQGGGIIVGVTSATVLIKGSVRDNEATNPSVPDRAGGIDANPSLLGHGTPRSVVIAIGVSFSGNKPRDCAPGTCVIVR